VVAANVLVAASWIGHESSLTWQFLAVLVKVFWCGCSGGVGCCGGQGGVLGGCYLEVESLSLVDEQCHLSGEIHGFGF